MYFCFCKKIVRILLKEHLGCSFVILLLEPQCFNTVHIKVISISCVIAARQWNHIEDLDDFFTRVYHYHQRSGFVCMVLQDVLQLMYALWSYIQFSFYVSLVLCIYCLMYDTSGYTVIPLITVDWHRWHWYHDNVQCNSLHCHSHGCRMSTSHVGGSVAEWLACRTQARKSTGSNRSRDAVE